jgi:uncharacterized protein (DUF4415 family)
MGLSKLIKNLQKSLASEADKKHASRERIEELLDQLEKKEKKLKSKLAKEKNPKKRKELKLQTKIVSTQRKKGKAFINKL